MAETGLKQRSKLRGDIRQRNAIVTPITAVKPEGSIRLKLLIDPGFNQGGQHRWFTAGGPAQIEMTTARSENQTVAVHQRLTLA